MDRLWAADIEIALIHTLINMLLMYRNGAGRLTEETFTAHCCLRQQCTVQGLVSVTEVFSIMVKMMKTISLTLSIITV